PSSATITSAPGNCSASARTVVAMRSSSSRAATRIETGSATAGGGGDLRQHAVPGGLLHAVLAGRCAGEEQGEREPAGLRVEVVDRREVLLRERVDRARPGPGHLHPHRRDAGGGEPRV